jgi:hypothetical protein
MAQGKVQNIVIFKATKTIVAQQLQGFIPGVTGPDLLGVEGSDDATFPYRFVIQGSETIINPNVTREDIQKIDVSPGFLVTNLVNLVDNTITTEQLVSVEFPVDEPLMIHFTCDLGV